VAVAETQLFCAQCNRFVLARKSDRWRCASCGGEALTTHQPPRWRLAYGGMVTDPFAPAEIRRLQQAAQLPPDAHAQPESGGAWIPLAQLKMPGDPPAKGKVRLAMGCLGMAVIFVAFVVYAAVRKPTLAEIDAAAKKREAAELEKTRRETVAKRTEEQAQANRKEWVCKVAVPSSDIPYIPLFPTEEDVSSGIDVYSHMKGEPGELARFVHNTGAIMVAKGTPCTWIDLAVFGPSKVRILEGPHAGKIGWAPTNWVRVEE
jgi:hypothetical protein